MELSRDIILRLLHELDRLMELEDCQAVDWVVCGGAALEIHELTTRPTRDVDVIGCWDKALMGLVCPEVFPEKVQTCIERVAASHPELSRLGRNWVNLGPRSLGQAGLPKDYAERLREVRIGSRLTLHLLGRLDLIALKLYAAADDRRARQEIHYGDLKSLAPTFDELDFAVEWLRTLRDFEEKRLVVKYVIERLGYDDLAYYV